MYSNTLIPAQPNKLSYYATEQTTTTEKIQHKPKGKGGERKKKNQTNPTKPPPHNNRSISQHKHLLRKGTFRKQISCQSRTSRAASSQQDRTLLVQAHKMERPQCVATGGEIKGVPSDFSCDCKPGEQLHLTRVWVACGWEPHLWQRYTPTQTCP